MSPLKSIKTFSIQPSIRVWTCATRVSSDVTLPTVRMERPSPASSTVANFTPINCRRSGEILTAPGGTDARVDLPVVPVAAVGSSPYTACSAIPSRATPGLSE